MPKTVAAEPYELDARITANAMEGTNKVRDKDKAAHQQPYDHKIVGKAHHGPARELFDADSDLLLVEEFGDLSFGQVSLRFLMV